MRRDFVFTGKGGQGIIFVANILCLSSLYENLHSIQTQIYTAVQRGDFSKSEVIISDKKIDYPKIEKADYFISLTKKSLIKFKELIDDNSIIIFDNSYDNLNDDLFIKNKKFEVPYTKLSYDNFKKSEYANMISLGFLISLLDFIKEESVFKSLEMIKKDFENNKRAFLLGVEFYNKLFVKKEV